MTPAARLQATLEMLAKIDDKPPRPADAIASDYFRARRYIGSHDRGAVSFMFYNALRHFGRTGWWVEKFEATALPRARFIAYLALAEKKAARHIDELFSGGKFAPAPLSDEERAFLRKLDGHTIAHPHMPEDIAVECPEWAAVILKKRFGKDFQHEMEALLLPAPLDLRVNAIKSSRSHVLNEIEKTDLKALPCRFSPLGIRIEERPSLNTLPMLKEGRVEIQDEGSQLAAAIVDARPGMRIVDFCAGAGGKTLAIAAQMQNKGRIVACDVLAGRLKRSTERFRRAGVHNIEVRPLKNERDPWVKKHKGEFDRVLVDAPCTGTGTWRRNPDARWRSLGPGLETLVILQLEILDSAARLVKKGGRLIYATCSLLPDENEKQIEKFIETHKDFRVVPYHEILTSVAGLPHDDYLMLTPAQHGTDGFFAAAMERT
jgi:16S rRNA (cytosine967-C5)-methyltransferase